MARKLFLIALVLIACLVLIAAQRVPINIHHLTAVKRVGTTTVSPKGDFAIYTVRFWVRFKFGIS